MIPNAGTFKNCVATGLESDEVSQGHRLRGSCDGIARGCLASHVLLLEVVWNALRTVEGYNDHSSGNDRGLHRMQLCTPQPCSY